MLKKITYYIMSRNNVISQINVSIYFLFFCLLFVVQVSLQDQSQIDIRRLQQSADETRVWLLDTFKSLSKHSQATAEYDNLQRMGVFEPTEVDPLEEVNSIAKKIGSLVGKKMSALKESVEFAEETAVQYKYNAFIRKQDVDFIDARKLAESDPRMEYDKMFLQKVVKNQSSVHIPLDIFDGDTELLNALLWATELDQIFQENKKKDKYLLWQYFGSQTGFFQTFPGMRWRSPKNKVDMYDVRRRPWYTQGSSSPKDMLFLIDTSGSMHGQSLTLTKKAIKNLIDTLGENDYVAVAQYPGRALLNEHTAEPHIIKDSYINETMDGTCFETFVQATKRNKDKLFRQILELEAHGIVEFEKAIEFAYQTFADFYENSTNNQGAVCNSVIMVLTDGDVGDNLDETKKVMDSFTSRNNITNDLLKRIRIFTYSIGQHQNPTNPLRELSCDTRGYFAEIPSMGAVSPQIQHIATVLSRPMTLYDAHYDLWHNIYLDSLGLGLMTSLTMPVYNRTGNQSFLGLIGTDITVKDLKNLVPLYKLGASGYAFAINANGYIVFHPELRAQRGWLRDPPNVDLIEVEFDSLDKREVRKRIIKSSLPESKVPDKMTIDTFVKFGDDIHTANRRRTYAYTVINDTAFGIAVVLPSQGHKYAKLHQSIHLNINDTTKNSTKFIRKQFTSTAFFQNQKLFSMKIPPDNFYILTSERIPYCEEYYIPPMVINRRGDANIINGSLINDENAHFDFTKSPEVSTTLWVLKDKIGDLSMNQSARYESTDGDQSGVHNYQDETKLIRHIPRDVVNLISTMHYNNTLCRPYWRRAVSLDLSVFNKLFSVKPDTLSHIQSLFISGISSMTAVYPKSEYSRYIPWSDGWKEGYYQRAVDSPKTLFVGIIPLKIGGPRKLSLSEANYAQFMNNTNSTVNSTTDSNYQEPIKIHPSVTLFQSVHLPNQVDFTLAVAGLTVKHKWIADKIFNDTFGYLCHSMFDNKLCYMLEDAGYVVSTNDDDDIVGYFLGHLDKPLMRYLVFNWSYFQTIDEFDYQGSCPEEKNSRTSSSQRLELHFSIINALTLINSITLNIITIISTVAQAVTQLVTSTFIFDILRPITSQEATNSANENVSCIKQGYRYYRNYKMDEISNGKDSLDRKITVVPIKDTNLLFVALDRDFVIPTLGPYQEMPLKDPKTEHLKTGNLDYDILRREPLPSFIKVCKAESRFRLRPAQCYNYHPLEDATECSAFFLKPSKLLFIFSTILFLFNFFSVTS